MVLTPEQYRVLVESAPTMIWRSGSDGVYDYFNERWLAFTGFPPDGNLSEAWARSIHPDDYQRCRETYLEHFGRSEPFEMEYRLLRHDGVYRYVLDRGIPYCDEAGDCSGFIGHCMDVHEWRMADEAKSTLVAMLAHELRTPLQTLTLCAREVRRATREGLPVSSHQAERLERQVGRLLRLVRHASSGIEAIARRQLDIEPTKQDLPELVQEVVLTKNEVTNRSIDFIFAFEGRPQPLWLDRERVTQVLEILLDNAEKFSPNDSRVVTAVRFDDQEIRVCVSDEGKGVSADDLERLGTPFFRGSNVSPREHPGLGLGLAIARSVAKAHGGRLEIESRASAGTDAALVFPGRLADWREVAS